MKTRPVTTDLEILQVYWRDAYCQLSNVHQPMQNSKPAGAIPPTDRTGAYMPDWPLLGSASAM